MPGSFCFAQEVIALASKPLRPCRKPGCTELTSGGYCPKHKPKRAARTVSADWHWMYSQPIWTQDLRPAQLLEEPFCRDCAKQNLRTRATVVDHIVPHRGDRVLFEDRKNLQSLCTSHHNAKTAREMAEYRRKTQRF